MRTVGGNSAEDYSVLTERHRATTQNRHVVWKHQWKQPNAAAEDMNHDFELISRWAHDWRMSFNPDTQKQVVELLLSKKKYEVDHPVILFNNIPMKKVEEHKHLGIILDSKLSFSIHIKSAISKTKKGIGLLKYLSNYLPRHTLNELYKLCVRPHLDYGDVIYHTPAKECEFSENIILPNLMEKLEAVQYSAALAVTKEDLGELIRNVKKASKEAGLLLNLKKTKVMTTAELNNFEVDGESIEVVQEFNFLGCTLTRTSDYTKEIRRRLMLGRKAMINLTTIMKDKNITLNTKIRITEALVFPVVTYGSETWVIRKTEMKKIEAFELWVWRRLLRVPWTTRRTNEWVLGQIKTVIEHHQKEAIDLLWPHK